MTMQTRIRNEGPNLGNPCPRTQFSLLQRARALPKFRIQEIHVPGHGFLSYSAPGCSRSSKSRKSMSQNTVFSLTPQGSLEVPNPGKDTIFVPTAPRRFPEAPNQRNPCPRTRFSLPRRPGALPKFHIQERTRVSLSRRPRALPKFQIQKSMSQDTVFSPTALQELSRSSKSRKTMFQDLVFLSTARRSSPEALNPGKPCPGTRFSFFTARRGAPVQIQEIHVPGHGFLSHGAPGPSRSSKSRKSTFQDTVFSPTAR